MSDDGCCDPVPLDGDALGGARRLDVAGFVALWRGDRPAVVDVCEDPAVIDTQIRAGRLEVDAIGGLLGVHGLTLRPTGHRIDHADGTIYTWCALDAIGISSALEITASARTSCPPCGADLDVALRDGEPDNPADTLRLWLPEGRCDHLVEDFCNHANLYCSAEHLTDTVPERSGGRMLTVDEVAAIGRRTWADAAALTGEGHRSP